MKYLYTAIAIIIVSLSCQEQFDFNTAEESAISINISTLDTKGSLALDDKSIGSIGLYCDLTGDDEGSFAKLDNRKYYYSSDDSRWQIDGDPEPWVNNDLDAQYTFFAYSPYVEDNGITPSIVDGELSINYTIPSDCALQPDLLIAVPHKDIEKPLSGYVPLYFHHALSTIEFKIKTDYDVKIKGITITGVANRGTLTWDYENEVPQWEISSRANKYNSFSIILDDDYTPITDGESSTSITATNGYLMMIPQTLKHDATVSIELEGDEEEISLTIPRGTIWSDGELYSYIITLIETKDYVEIIYDSEQISNCYIVNPTADMKTVIQIPVQDRINDFWENYSTEPQTPIATDFDTNDFSAEMLWDDFDGSGDYECEVVKDADQKMAVRVSLPADIQEGNTVFVVKDSSDNILWSWHLWVTDYNPDAIVEANKDSIVADTDKEYTTDDETGAVHRYTDSKDETIWSGIYSDKFIMDRNIGARDTGLSSDNTGVLSYQFGRKDPLPSGAICYNDKSKGSTLELICMNEGYFVDAVRNPGAFFYSSNSSNDYYWCIESIIDNKDVLWNDKSVPASGGSKSKSIFDPSPLGWRVPTKGTWSNIDDTGSGDSDNPTVAEYPIYGYRHEQSGGITTSSYTYFWSATPSPSDYRCSSMRYSKSYVSGYRNSQAGRGMQVRAVQE